MMRLYRFLLLPFSWLYGGVVHLRNILYDKGLLASKRAALPTIAIGNISLGGTGKSPHTLWLAKALADQQPVVLSRGYGRSTKGFRWVEANDEPSLCGDEPLMLKLNHPGLEVAVCEDRLEGIRRIAESGRGKFVILDDAMQHRPLKADLYIALLRGDRLPTKDAYLPAGRLRDHRSRLKCAEIVLITHLQKDGVPPHPPGRAKTAQFAREAHLQEGAMIMESRTHYTPLRQVNGAERPARKLVLVSGIAHPEALAKHLETKFELVQHFAYRDHQAFKASDLQKWTEAAKTQKADGLVTTAKDHVRMRQLLTASDLPVYIQDIEVLPEQGEALLDFVRQRLRHLGV